MAGLAVSPALAESSKSSAVASAGADLTAADPAAPIMSTQLRAPNAKEFVIDVSLQCGLYTYTKVKGKGGDRDSATAAARVTVAVEILDSDLGQVAVNPASAVFCERQQQLDAKLGGVIDNLLACTNTDAEENVACTLSDEEIALALKTLSANSYIFYVLNLPGSDVYTINVYAVLDACDDGVVVSDPADDFFGSCSDGNDPDASARAFVNGASMHVEEARFVNSM